MNVTKSPLILHDFYILDSKYRFNESSEGKINVSEVFSRYNIDFDFAATEQKNGEIFLFTKIGINNEGETLSGYSIFVESISILGFDNTVNLSDKEKADFINISGLSIAINNLRTYISNITTYCPLGKFQVPTLDVGALHKEKQKELKLKKANK